MNSDLTLIFPPFCESSLNGPHLAPPILKGVGKSVGLDVGTFDFNVLMIKELTRPHLLELVINLLPQYFDAEELVKEKARFCDILERENLFKDKRDTKLYDGFLKTVREVLFPAPKSFSVCLKEEIVREQAIEEVYLTLFNEVFSQSDVNVIGFSIAFSDQLVEAIYLSKLVKRIKPNIKILLGGSQINLLEDSQINELIASNIFSKISIGNGEQTLPLIMEEIDTIKVLYRSGSMNREQINQIPIPNFENLEIYGRPLSIPVLVTKGCYWGKCTFCDYPKLSNLGGKRYIGRDAEIVMDEIEELNKNFAPEKILLISDAVPPPWYLKLAKLAINRGVKLKSWSYMMHQKNLDKDFFQTLDKAGVRRITFGTESANDRILDVMKKQVGSSMIEFNLKSAKGTSIEITCNVIPDYPTTTREEAFEVFNKFKNWLPLMNAVNPQMFDLTAGTPISENPGKFEVNINTNAYVKTNHGFHAMEYERTAGLNENDRKMLKLLYFKLKTQKMIKKRTENSPLNSQEEQFIYFDQNVILYQFEGKYIFNLISLSFKIEIKEWEFSVLREISLRKGGKISNVEVKTLFLNVGQSSDKVQSWLSTMRDMGVIVFVQSLNQAS